MQTNIKSPNIVRACAAQALFVALLGLAAPSGAQAQLDALNNQLWDQESSGIPGAGMEFDAFGAKLATGDFNKDGFDDLAIGIPGKSITVMEGTPPAAVARQEVGRVVLIYGGSDRLQTIHGAQLIAPPNAQIIDVPSPRAAGLLFGSALASGDFNGDGCADLAVGAPAFSAEPATPPLGGEVYVFNGCSTPGARPSGPLSLAPSGVFSQANEEILGSASNRDGFGAALASGDFNFDAFDDLAIGVPGESITPADGGGPLERAGAVNVLYGSAAGLSVEGDQFFSLLTPGTPETAASGDNFGFALTTGDFNNDKHDDLAIGAPFRAVEGEEGEDTATSAGAVLVLLGGPMSLTATDSELHTQNSLSSSRSEDGDVFGLSLAAGDFNLDEFDDLAIGAPGEGIGEVGGVGSVHVVLGGGGGLVTDSGIIQFVRDNIGPEGGRGLIPGANFGETLAVGDFNADGPADLAIGAPGDDSGAAPFSLGSVSILMGNPLGLDRSTPNDAQFWDQDSESGTPPVEILGVAQATDRFSFGLAAGDFDRSGKSDLAVGSFEDAMPPDGGSILGTGAVNVIYGLIEPIDVQLQNQLDGFRSLFGSLGSLTDRLPR